MVVWDLATVSKSSLYTSRPTLAPFAKLTAVDPEIEFAPAKSVLAEALEAFYNILDRFTLAQITAEPVGLRTLLKFGEPA